MGRKRKSYEEILDYFESDSTCKLITTLDEYNELCEKNSPSKINFTILCSKCKENTFLVTMSRFKARNKTICYDCAIKNRTWSIDKVQKFVKENSDCILLSERYNGVLELLLYQCACGSPFKTTFTKFKEHNRRNCEECSEKIRRRKISTYSYEDVCSYIKDKGCILLVGEKEYNNSMELLWIAGTCNHMFQISFLDFRRRKQNVECPDCMNRTIWDIQNIKGWMKQHTSGHKLISRKYKDQKTKLKIECPKGHLYEKSWTHVLRGQLCSVCTSSSGEQAIQNYLEEHEINFKRQYWFYDCKDERPLPFDFGVLSKSGKLNCLIEFNGRQHYQPVDFGDITKREAEIVFIDRQKKDSIKESYCKKNNIKLIIIPYWEFSKINEVLERRCSK